MPLFLQLDPLYSHESKEKILIPTSEQLLQSGRSIKETSKPEKKEVHISAPMVVENFVPAKKYLL